MTVQTLFLDMVETANTLDPPLERDNTKPHVSQLIELANQVAGQRPRSIDETGAAMMSMGRLWELIARPLVTKLAAVSRLDFEQSPVLELEDIIGSLDGRLWDYGTGKIKDGTATLMAVVEFKCRFTQPSDPLENWRWMAQVKAYCKMSGCKEAWILVLYLPRGEPKPAIALHLLEFDQLALDENWRMLLNVKESIWQQAKPR